MIAYIVEQTFVNLGMYVLSGNITVADNKIRLYSLEFIIFYHSFILTLKFPDYDITRRVFEITRNYFKIP